MKKKILSRRKVSLRKDNKNPKQWHLLKKFTMKPKKVTRVTELFKDRVFVCLYHRIQANP